MDQVRRPRGRPRKPALLGPVTGSGRLSLHEQAVRRLRAMIVEGALPAGAPLVETELSEALGVSRTPLREAVKLLAMEGLVELRPNRSPRIAALDPEAVRALFEALAWIERAGAELAAQRMGRDDLDRLQALQAAIEAHHRNGEIAPYFAANHATHALIVACAGNPPLREAHEALHARAEIARRRALDSHGRWSESVAEHRAILAALVARDGPRAGLLLAEHVSHTGAALLAALSRSDAA
ncbi:GntR family transcriptional regulator [Methylobacterium sp. WSM2598]|uniref:GntR family transcriptional regulator n=1 Tax=Methylobacterium sp. WSM2598 TaxID=398261 RepID=UPI000376D961|nr:GntR family transcriptional regulator [Methylobacterium sp. WSM2598]